MRYLLLLTLLIPALSLSQYEFDRSPIDECWVEISGEYCKDDQVLARDAFVTAGRQKMQEINSVFLEKIDPLWVDNGAHGNTLVKESINIYRTYNYCLSTLCRTIRNDCGAGFADGNQARNFNLCNNHREDLLVLAQAQIKSALLGNIDRKQRSLWLEKLSAISLRFDQYLHPRLRQTNRELAGASGQILALAKLLWQR